MQESILHTFNQHINGLINGDNLRESEARHWVWLLELALNTDNPVQVAQHYGFHGITTTDHILQYIDTLISNSPELTNGLKSNHA